MNREPPAMNTEQSPARERMSLGLTLRLPRDEQALLSTAWFEDVRLARALLAGTFWVRGLPTHPQHLPTEDAPPRAAFRALDGLLEAAARWRTHVVVQIGDAENPANLQAVGVICRRLKGQVEAYVLSAGESAGGGQVRSLLSLARLARQTDPTAKVGLHGSADALVELHRQASEELEPVNFAAFCPQVATDHRGWRARAREEVLAQVERVSAVGMPVWICGIRPRGCDTWSPLVPDRHCHSGLKQLLLDMAEASVEGFCLDGQRGVGGLVSSNGRLMPVTEAFSGFHGRPSSRVAVYVDPLRLRTTLPAEVHVGLQCVGDVPRKGRLRLEYAGKVGTQASVCVEPPDTLKLTLTIHPEHLSDGASLMFARFAYEGPEADEVYGFNQVVRPLRPTLSASQSASPVTYHPSMASVSAFLARSVQLLAIVTGSGGVASRLAGRLRDRLERMTGRLTDGRLATEAGDVMDRPLILLTVGEDNVLARVAGQGLKKGRITGRSPAAGKGRIVHISSPFGETADDPRCAQVGLYYDAVPEALIVGGSDEAGLTAAVENLLERMPPFSGVQP